MNKKWNPLLVGAMSVASIGFMAGWSQPPDKYVSAHKNVSASSAPIIVAQSADVQSLDPSNTHGAIDIKVDEEIFETLTTYKPGTTTLEGLLATNWKVSKNGLQWTFHLRKGVKFQDGTPFNAAAVVFNFDRWWNPKDPYHTGVFSHFASDLGGFKGSPGAVIKSVKALNNDTVQIDLTYPFAPLTAMLSQTPYGFISPAAIKKYKSDITTHPIGTGPFELQSWSQGNQIVLAKNDHYWEAGYPKANEVIFKVISSTSAALNALEAGEVDLTAIDPIDIPTVASNQNLHLFTDSGNDVGYLAFNTKKKPFNNVLVRQAVALAINKPSIVKAFFPNNSASVANSIIPSANWAYDQKLGDYKVNIKKAKQLLAKAGYSHGLNTQLWSMNTSRDYFPQPMDVATAIQSDLEKIGINVKIVTYDWATYLQRTGEGDDPMCLHGWIGSTWDPSPFINLLNGSLANETPSINVSFYKSASYDQAINKAISATSNAERKKLYAKAQQVVLNDAPIIPIDYAHDYVAGIDTLHGYIQSTTEGSNYKGAWIS